MNCVTKGKVFLQRRCWSSPIALGLLLEQTDERDRGLLIMKLMLPVPILTCTKREALQT